MAKNWDYAELSKMANEAGGPNKLMDSVIKTSNRQGKIEMIPWIGLATLGGSVIALLVEKLIENFKKTNQNEIEVNKKELIDEITQYSDEYSDDSEF